MQTFINYYSLLKIQFWDDKILKVKHLLHVKNNSKNESFIGCLSGYVKWG